MARIARLAVDLTANTGKFTTGMKSARKDVKGFGTDTAATIKKLVAFGAAGYVATKAFSVMSRGIRSAVGYIKTAMDEIDAVKKFSDRLGLATEELIGFRHAAALAGVDGEKLEVSLQKMSRTIGDAVTGGSESGEMLKNLGLDPKELSLKTTAEQLYMIADAIAEIPVVSARVNATLDIFGKAGGTMINLFEDGSAALKEGIRDVEDLGIAYSSIDAKPVEAANDALKRMGQTLTGVANTAAIELSPAIKTLADEITDIITSTDSFSNAIIDGVEAAAHGVKFLTDKFAKLELIMLKFERTKQGLYGIYGSAQDQLENAKSRVFAGGDESDPNTTKPDITGRQLTRAFIKGALDMRINELEKGIEEDSLGKYFDSVRKKFQENKTSAANDAFSESMLKQWVDEPGGAGGPTGKTAADYTAALEAAEGREDLAQEADRLKEEMLTPQEKYVDALSKITSLYEAELIDITTADRATADAIQTLVEDMKKIDEASLQGQYFKEGNRITEDNMTTLEEYQKTLQNLDELQSAGAITEETFWRAVKKTQDELGAGDILDDIKTPMEKYQTEIEKLDDLLRAGVISWDIYGRAAGKAWQDMEEEMNKDKEKMEGIKTGEFKQYDSGIGSLAIGGARAYGGTLGKKQGVRDEQLMRTNTLLEQIVGNTRGGRPAYAV